MRISNDRLHSDSNGTPKPSHRRAQIDNLVAGDLGEPERTDLIDWLEETPERWRMCGIAFLEASLWKESMGEEEAAESISDTSASLIPTIMTNSQSRLKPRILTNLLSLASAVCLAFLAGWYVRPAEVLVKSTPVAVNEVPATPTPSHILRVVQHLHPPAREFRLPILDARLPDEHWARQADIPEYVKSRWRENGYEISERKEFVPVKLANGSRIVLAMNRVTLTYRGSGIL